MSTQWSEDICELNLYFAERLGIDKKLRILFNVWGYFTFNFIFGIRSKIAKSILNILWEMINQGSAEIPVLEYSRKKHEYTFRGYKVVNFETKYLNNVYKFFNFIINEEQ